MQVNPLFLPELREMLTDNNIPEMQEFCAAIHPVRVAEFMGGLEPIEIWQIIQQADLETRVQIFNYLDEQTQAEIMEAAPREEMAAFISHLPSDDRVDALQSVEEQIVEELMPLIDEEDRRDIRRLTAFPEDSCGSEMTTDFLRLYEDMTVEQAVQEVATQSETKETVYYLYVVDQNDHLVGLVSAKQLLKNLSRPQKRIRDLMLRDLITVGVDDNKEEAAQVIAKYDFLALPVVDEEHRMLGIITHDDMMDVIRDEATEDAYLMGAVGPLEESYLNVPFWTMWKSRVFWLACLFVAEIGTFSALAHFDEALKLVPVLVLFVPLVISTGGNSGSQAATLITRALALGDVKLADFLRIFRHELIMGVALGAALGGIGFVRAYLTPASILEDANRFFLAITICLAVGAVCLCGTLIGALLPLVFKRFGVDPGVASSPFVATFVDVVGITIYCTIAGIFLL
ncbi:MAG: magnesium transporter [Thermoguttaceae bacterium]